MAVTEAQARRAVRRAEFEWDPLVADGRDEKNQRHAHQGILAVTTAAFACARVQLRRVEDFNADLGPGARKRLGSSRQISDSTFYRTLSKQKPRGLRETVRNQVRDLVDRKVVANDIFPLGVLSIDGKLLWSSTSHTVDGAKMSIDENSGVVTASLMSVRAVLTSSKVAPCLDVEVIGDKTGEPPAFRELFPRVNEHFGRHFDIVTADAGLTCRENALRVTGVGKWYLFGLKGNQPKLHELAEQMFRDCPGTLKARSDDWRNGAAIIRELHTITVKDVAEIDVSGIQQLWRVRQQTFVGEKVVAEEVRYFISSTPPTRLSPTQQLRLVRLHWCIENGHNWTMDMALLEDDVQPCQANRDAIESIGWLRILGYNLLSAWRAQAPKKDRQPASWARCIEQLRDAFVFGTGGALRATLA